MLQLTKLLDCRNAAASFYVIRNFTGSNKTKAEQKSRDFKDFIDAENSDRFKYRQQMTAHIRVTGVEKGHGKLKRHVVHTSLEEVP